MSDTFHTRCPRRTMAEWHMSFLHTEGQGCPKIPARKGSYLPGYEDKNKANRTELNRKLRREARVDLLTRYMES